MKTNGRKGRTGRNNSVSPAIDPHAIIDEARSFFLRKEGDQALSIISDGLKLAPLNFHLRFEYAKILGDIAHSKSAQESARMRRKSIRILKELCRSSKRQTAEDRWKVRRHFFHFTEQHLKNYHLGIREVARGNKLGYLSQAFGAEGHALKLLLDRNRVVQAEEWAQRAERAWRQLFKIDVVQFNRLCSYAVAQAIQGENKAARETVRKAAKLAKKPLSNFSELLDIIQRIKQTRTNA